jgi:N-formylglutamate deformylase
MKLYEFSQGRTPLFISMPHDGTRIPEDLEMRMTERALQRPDTDWHVASLYQFAAELGASLIRPLHHRYVVDLNRAPDNTTLYPDNSNTEVCPSSCFDDSPIYQDGTVPDATEVAERIDIYWRPYHQRLQQELARIRNAHGIALLYEAHTIRSRVPRFFQGVLPDFNLGTADTKSCAPPLEQHIADVLARLDGFTHVVNGRFKGGYITRAYGKPGDNIHAVQLELSQRTYMDEDHPYAYREQLAQQVQPALKSVLTTMLKWADSAKLIA